MQSWFLTQTCQVRSSLLNLTSEGKKRQQLREAEGEEEDEDRDHSLEMDT